MQYRDYLQDQAEQFGKALRQLVAGMLGRDIPAALQNEAADDLLQEQCGVRLDDIPGMEPEEITQLLRSPLLQRQNAELLAELLVVYAEECRDTDREKARKAAHAASYILHFTDRRESAVSLHRMALLERSDPKRFP